jgi:hypothetical protein
MVGVQWYIQHSLLVGYARPAAFSDAASCSRHPFLAGAAKSTVTLTPLGQVAPLGNAWHLFQLRRQRLVLKSWR